MLEQDNIEPNRSNELLRKHPLEEPVTELDAADVQTLFRSAHDWLAQHYEQVNRLNVFPVPDGDTGTNMLMTLQSAWANVVAHAEQTVGGVVKAASEGAHSGSRGNSGVILGRILRGLSDGLAEKIHITAQDLAEALQRASKTAYESVPIPIEGTILSVAQAISSAATAAIANTLDLRTMLGQIVAAADEAVRHTPEQLPVLKQAGVVDSGGKGLFYIFEGMYRALIGRSVQNGGVQIGESVLSPASAKSNPNKGRRTLPVLRYGFDVQFLVEQPNQSITQIRSVIQAMGDCPLVEGDDTLVKVHVHVFDPSVPLAYAVKLGFVTDIVVENMDDMASRNEASRNEEIGDWGDANSQLAIRNSHLNNTIGIAAVSPGAGFSELFRSLGVESIVTGGQSMNPSTAELVEAVRQLPTQRVILLPNNRNIHMAASQAVVTLNQEDERTVILLPTRNPQQAVAALLAFDPTASDLTDLAAVMEAQMAAVHAGEVTQAVRSAEVDGLRVERGDFIGLHDERLVVRSDHLNDALFALLDQMMDESIGLITIYYADFIAKDAAENLIGTVRAKYARLDVELAYGGQPLYHYLVSTE